MDPENIIASVPGQYIAQALNKLPSPETAAPELLDATIDVPGIGPRARDRPPYGE